jgi:hypothetical protein
MDLLTAVMHELGHALGLVDLDGPDDLMAGVLRPGSRYLPTAADVDRALANSAVTEEMSGRSWSSP